MILRTQAEVLPLTVTVEACVARTGWSRSEIYRLLAAGRLTARKQARKTLIEWASVIEHHKSLPAADFRPLARAA